jgi:hypothetical protein
MLGLLAHLQALAASPLSPVSPRACPDDPYELNDNFCAVYLIAAGPEYLAYTCSCHDADCFQFDAGAGQQITVDLYGILGDNLPADLDPYLYHPSGGMAASSAQSGVTPEPIVFTATETGRYRVGIWGYEGAWRETDPYWVKVTLSGATATPTPTRSPTITRTPTAIGGRSRTTPATTPKSSPARRPSWACTTRTR